MHLTTWWSTWRGYRQNLSTYYLRSPFRSHFFVAPTLLLVTDFFLMGAILVKNWSRLPTWTINLLGLVFFGLILAWRMAFRTHQAMQRFLRSTQIEKLDLGSPLETALYLAASTTYYSSCFT